MNGRSAVPSNNLKRISLLLATTTFLALSADGASAQQPAAIPTASTTDSQVTSKAALSDQEMQILVARIALYPDELVALITSASLYPLQVVEAARFLDTVKTNSSLKPKEEWDGSVISLLNYPQIVKMMSDDLEWTQAIGNAVASQQKDMLVAIQTLRDKAVADGVIKSDDKVQVTKENNNVVIKSADPQKIYVPQYEPQMLYESGYAVAPVSYYPDPYPNYYYPTATYFAGFVTGAVFAAAVDWDDWGVWGGRYDGADIDIDCNHCMNNIDLNGRVNFNDVDWKDVDRSKLSFDHSQFSKIDSKNIRTRLEKTGGDNIRNRAQSLKTDKIGARQNKISTSTIKDVRANKVQGTRKAANIQSQVKKRPSKAAQSHNGPAHTVKHSMAGKHDVRPKRPSGLGEVRPRASAHMSSQRGGRAMGGGHQFERRSMGGGHARMPHGHRR
ncbi:DUF3300 domain-containing protein [Ochrobactrum vermis]|uniref:DUF3300 domain-containing protein n=1 Tax=Ochrobactrum vermis TaxID=1827297 RepID=A0ABU8PB57_9HYPH|nr:DUF3300 domain-containing protein [Ochrobactrum vermis]PQZ29337.1 hypothetical protein CQZ93_03495 [Ochrobactrum vermis]